MGEVENTTKCGEATRRACRDGLGLCLEVGCVSWVLH